MTTNLQKSPLKQWHKALLRLTLPIVWVVLFMCLLITLIFLGPLCAIAAFVSWVIFKNPYAGYTVVWCVFPLFLIDTYVNWLKKNNVIE